METYICPETRGCYTHLLERDMFAELEKADRVTRVNLRRGHPLLKKTGYALPVLNEDDLRYPYKSDSLFSRICEDIEDRLLQEDGEVRVHVFPGGPRTQVGKLNMALAAKFQNPRVKFIEVDPGDWS